MNKQVLKYLMIALVLFIWVKIGIEVFSGLSDSSEFQISGERVVETPISVTPYIAYELKASYRDPFLGTLTRVKKTESEPSPQKGGIGKRKLDKPEKPPIPWPELKYLGLVSNELNTFAIIEHNKTEYILTIGDSILNLKLSNIWKDSIKFEQRSSIKIYPK